MNNKRGFKFTTKQFRKEETNSKQVAQPAPIKDEIKSEENENEQQLRLIGFQNQIAKDVVQDVKECESKEKTKVDQVRISRDSVSLDVGSQQESKVIKFIRKDIAALQQSQRKLASKRLKFESKIEMAALYLSLHEFIREITQESQKQDKRNLVNQNLNLKETRYLKQSEPSQQDDDQYMASKNLEETYKNKRQDKINEMLQITDSFLFAQNFNKTDRTSQSVKEFELSGFNLLSLTSLLKLLINIISEIIEQTEIPIDLKQLDSFQLQMKLQATQYNGDALSTAKQWSHTIQLKEFLLKIYKILTYSDLKSLDCRVQQKELLRLIGFDSTLSKLSSVNSGIQLQISKLRLFHSENLPVSKMESGEGVAKFMNSISYEGYFKADTTLYAISRARIQYLGQNIPIFKFRNTLFEALISSLHPDKVSPMSDSIVDLSPEEQQKQQDFLLRKYVEFSKEQSLRPLIEFSKQNDTVGLIRYFNSMRNEEKRYSCYQQKVLCLYDINQRKFIQLSGCEQEIQSEDEEGCSQPLSDAESRIAIREMQVMRPRTDGKREAYLVHYNGYVFGTNYAKLMVIRERETATKQQGKGRLADFDDFDDFFLKRDSDLNDEHQSNLEMNEASHHLKDNQAPKISHSIFSNIEEFDQEQIDLARNIDPKDEDAMSHIEVKQSFIMSSGLLRTGTRRQKIDKLSQKNADKTCRAGLLAYKIEFEEPSFENTDTRQINRVHCYGSPGYKGQFISNVFEGKNAVVEFCLWLLESCIDYFKDSRCHTRFLNVFSHNGQSREMPLILRTLAMLMGRDVHFIGDTNHLKLIWIENIRFYDLSNYFEDCSIDYLIKLLQITTPVSVNLVAESKARLIYHLALEFTQGLRKFRFLDNQVYDFTLNGQGTCSSLALNIFQYFYLTKQHLRGTHELDIFEKEKLSMKSPYFFFNNLQSHQFEFERHTYRLFKIDHSIASCFMNYPVPIEFSRHRDNLDIELNFQNYNYKFDYRTHQSLEIYGGVNPQSVKLMYTSLYHVKMLIKRDRSFAIPAQTYSGLDIKQTKLQNEYIWGVELIEAILGQNQILFLSLDEELIYFQSKIFQPFVRDLVFNYQRAESDLQRLLIKKMLDSFYHRFTQRHVGMNMVMHINDLTLLRETCMSSDSQIQRVYEISHPFYFIEYFPDGSDPLQQMGSLYRLSSYANACHRTMLTNYIGRIYFSNILFMDQSYLLLKNSWIDRQKLSQTSRSQNFEALPKSLGDIGKYQLLIETRSSYQKQQEKEFDFEAVEQIERMKLQEYAEFFKQRLNSFQDIDELTEDKALQNIRQSLSIPPEIDDRSEEQKIQECLDQLSELIERETEPQNNQQREDLSNQKKSQNTSNEEGLINQIQKDEASHLNKDIREIQEFLKTELPKLELSFLNERMLGKRQRTHEYIQSRLQDSIYREEHSNEEIFFQLKRPKKPTSQSDSSCSLKLQSEDLQDIIEVEDSFKMKDRNIENEADDLIIDNFIDQPNGLISKQIQEGQLIKAFFSQL